MNTNYNESTIEVKENFITDQQVLLSSDLLSPLVIDITEDEKRELIKGVDFLCKTYGNYENPKYIIRLHQHAFQLLPDRIVSILNQFGVDYSATQYGAIIFKGVVDVDQVALGATPRNWQSVDYRKLNRYGFICSLLHGAVPSKPVQYYAQRKGGGLLHAIIPDDNMTFAQTGSGSGTDLYVHTEDAFLLHQADFLSFLYLRNEEQVPSTLYSIRSHRNINQVLKNLFEPIYKCPMDANYDDMSTLQNNSVTTSILYGNRELPFIRFDAAEQIFNENAGQSLQAQKNLLNFWEEAKNLINSEFVPESGDVIFVNNHLCAHGRSAFVAGLRNDNGRMIPCERRLMLRMMSKTSLINIQSVTRNDNPYFIMEKHLGQIFNAAEANSINAQ